MITSVEVYSETTQQETKIYNRGEYRWIEKKKKKKEKLCSLYLFPLEFNSAQNEYYYGISNITNVPMMYERSKMTCLELRRSRLKFCERERADLKREERKYSEILYRERKYIMYIIHLIGFCSQTRKSKRMELDDRRSKRNAVPESHWLNLTWTCVDRGTWFFLQPIWYCGNIRHWHISRRIIISYVLSDAHWVYLEAVYRRIVPFCNLNVSPKNAEYLLLRMR